MYAYEKMVSYDNKNGKYKDIKPKLILYYPKMENNEDEKYTYFDGSKISIKFLDMADILK